MGRGVVGHGESEVKTFVEISILMGKEILPPTSTALQFVAFIACVACNIAFVACNIACDIAFIACNIAFIANLENLKRYDCLNV